MIEAMLVQMRLDVQDRRSEQMFRLKQMMFQETDGSHDNF